ncbi:hypothetical protein Poli38472_007562 [Pythium oligandrum]|uniref:BZIP domain-containing protein n=1 Tax=Pythium oligandrum TaxID=41045 RepID=A0A8K1FL62_PYTOL|nr:hypothetical protein Poli38472_007562 [Pythium oligandrum]|eukprot:TMW67890.1 hypothetical protein Poli38472_007562 [Pythium oligandrum]
MELDADPATLDAIVAFLDDYQDADASAWPGIVGTESSSSLTSSDGVESAKRKRSTRKAVNSNRARERKKREFLRLQQAADELDRQLTSLLQAKADRMTRAAQESAKRSLELHRERMSAWKEMAVRQFCRRNAAEAENVRLKELVAEQRDVLCGLKRILERQLANAKFNASPHVHVGSWSSSCHGDARSMMQMVAELLAGLKSAYSSTDACLASTQSMRAAGLDDETRLVELSTSQFAIEIVNMRFFPFDPHRVAEAYWAMGLNYYYREFDIAREQAEVEGRETIFLDQISQDWATGRVNGRKHSSVQRFVEKDRVVAILAFRYNTIQVLEEELSETVCSGYHWSVFQPPEVGASDACHWVSSVRINLHIHDGLTLSPEIITVLYEYFVAKLKRDVDTMFELMEDWLLQTPGGTK